MNRKNDKKALGRVDVSRKAVRIQDLGDKVGVAISQFQAAQKKFEQGQDSYKEWQRIIKLLDIEIKDIEHFKAVAHHNMGVIHAGRREFKRAEEMFRQAVKLDPDYALAWYNLAVTYKHTKEMEKCKECFYKAKQLGYPPPP